MTKLSQEVMQRGNEHDASKFGPEELPQYVATADEFEKYPYGSDGYNKAKESLGPAIIHHFKNNRHHPEHFDNGIAGMDLVDLLEMLVDWKSATLNNPKNPGNLAKSISVAEDKYKISPDLSQILYNTAVNFKML